MLRYPAFVCITAVALASSACGSPQENDLTPGSEGSSADGGAQAVAATTVPSGTADPRSSTATVKETANAAGYTYALLELDGEEAWVAGPMTVLKVGDEVSVSRGVPMSNFTSSALGRTFELIYLVDSFTIPGATASPDDGSGGEVLEVIPAGDYTYLRVQGNEGEIWVAAPATPVEVGARVAWADAVPMDDFTSSTLNRTFEQILFLGSIEIR
jgi:hypothetical protein